MTNIFSFLNQFIARGGLQVFASAISIRFSSIIVAVIVARLLTVEDFSRITFVLFIITPLLPFAGAGLDLAVLKFCAIRGEGNDRELIYNAIRKKAVFSNILILSCCYILITVFLSNSIYYDFLLICTALLYTDFSLRFIQNRLRTLENNSEYARSGMYRAVSLVVLALSFVYLYGANGYLIAIVLSPLLVSIYYNFFSNALLHSSLYSKITVSDADIVDSKVFYKYGLFVALGAVVSQLTLPLGGIILQWMAGNDSDLALYRVASLIPLSLLFLPDIFFKSEFVHIAKNSDNSKMIKSYIFNYLKISLICCTFMLIISLLMDNFIVYMFFGDKYGDSGHLFSIFIFGVCGAILLRQPFGNLTAASGKAIINVYSAFISLVVSTLIIYFMTKNLGLLGAAWGASLSFWVSGFVNAFLYFRFVYRRSEL